MVRTKRLSFFKNEYILFSHGNFYFNHIYHSPCSQSGLSLQLFRYFDMYDSFLAHFFALPCLISSSKTVIILVRLSVKLTWSIRWIFKHLSKTVSRKSFAVYFALLSTVHTTIETIEDSTWRLTCMCEAFHIFSINLLHMLGIYVSRLFFLI